MVHAALVTLLTDLFWLHVCICSSSSWLKQQEAQLPRSCSSAGSQRPLVSHYSSWMPRNVLVILKTIARRDLFIVCFGAGFRAMFYWVSHFQELVVSMSSTHWWSVCRLWGTTLDGSIFTKEISEHNMLGPFFLQWDISGKHLLACHWHWVCDCVKQK